MSLRNVTLTLGTILFLMLATTTPSMGQERNESMGGGIHDTDRTSLIDDTTTPTDDNQKNTSKPPTESQKELYAKLAKRLTGTKWTGNFTISGQDLGNLTAEEYEILSAKKADKGEYWHLTVRIKYGKNDMTLPLPPIEILWAGKSPVITVDRLAIPLLGTFDARVIIRGNKYAGTWAHDKVGGHLFGTIEKLPEQPKKNN